MMNVIYGMKVLLEMSVWSIMGLRNLYLYQIILLRK